MCNENLFARSFIVNIRSEPWTFLIRMGAFGNDAKVAGSQQQQQR